MKIRLDQLLVLQKLVTGRDRAKALIVAGDVFVEGIVSKKPSEKFDENIAVTITGEAQRYVSRGGLKLEKAVRDFGICLSDKICVDIGASTGGFTDVMLQKGARKVYAIDVGSNQLVESIRLDKRVVVRENTNARTLTADDFNEAIEFISVDVSFISLELIFPAISRILDKNGQSICLIKPQFEAGKGNIGKNGLVQNYKLHIKIVEQVVASAFAFGLYANNLTFSPIKGARGNIEYLIQLSKNKSSNQIDPTKTVCNAFDSLKE